MKKYLLVAACLLGVTVMNAVELIKDPAVYVEKNGYVLKNLWIKSDKTGNSPVNDLGGALGFASRGMAVLGDDLLFCRRGGDPIVAWIDVYDLHTGVFKKKVNLASNVFQGKGSPCNDIQVDDAGNVLVSELSSSVAKTGFQVWKINMQDGTGVKIIDCKLPFIDSSATGPTLRIDAFGVFGDVNGNAYVMAAIAGDVIGIGDQVLRWDFVNGQPIVSYPDYAADPAAIADPTSYPKIIAIQKYYPAKAISNGTAPRVCPISNDYFYLDGFNSLATLYDMDGTLVDSFEQAPSLTPPQAGNNGVDEFELNGKNFIVYIYTNTVPTTNPQAWSLAEMGPGPAFSGMTGYYIFPEQGMGGAISNDVRTAVPCIQVKEAEKVALISVYACKSGVGAYVFGKTADVDAYIATNTSVESVTSGFSIVPVNGGIELSESASVKIYNFAGQQIVAQPNVTFVPLKSGQYIVKAVTVDGQNVAQKVIIP